MKRLLALGLRVLALCLVFSGVTVADEVVIKPKPYDGALRNPLMGFRPDWKPNMERDWPTLARTYIKWNEIENDETDGIEKIRAYCDAKWKGAAEANVKLIPRVYLHWSKDDQKYWPADLQTDDYTSEKFQRRVLRLIERLGQVWDNDPRVAWVQMGLIGKWGEHHSPDISPQMQKLLGDAFTRAFPNKKVLVRHAWDFADYKFGIYWDSFAHIQQDKHAQGILKLGDRWKIAPIEGEVAYDWGRYKEQPGESPNLTLGESQHRNHLINMIRQLHCSGLGWVANYDRKNEAASAGAIEVQKAFGYRFVLDEVRFPDAITSGEKFSVSFTVRNTGSTPFYYPWPVQLSVLGVQTKKPVWSANFNTDIRKWLPGEDWDSAKQQYVKPAAPNVVKTEFLLPRTLPQGEYFLALAVCDPAGNLPSARFATAQYFTGGYHPIGRIGVGQKPEKTEISAALFDDPKDDKTLRYISLAGIQ